MFNIGVSWGNLGGEWKGSFQLKALSFLGQYSKKLIKYFYVVLCNPILDVEEDGKIFPNNWKKSVFFSLYS